MSSTLAQHGDNPYGSGSQGEQTDPHPFKVTLNVIVKERLRQLCTIKFDETQTIGQVKDAIVRKNKKILIKNLFVRDEQVKGRIVRVVDLDKEFTDRTRLITLGMHEGKQYKIHVSFSRALAFMNQSQLDALVTQINNRTNYIYENELVIQAINMGQNCTFNEALSNLVNFPSRVFESILEREVKGITD